MGANPEQTRSRRYFLDIFSVATWGEFLAAGAQVSGFRQGSWPLARRVQPGDMLLCYLVGVSRFVGLLEVTSSAYIDNKRIWTQALFPVRLDVRVVAQLDPEHGVSIKALLPQFSWYPTMSSPKSWQGRLQNSLREWGSGDAEIVVAAVLGTSDPERPDILNAQGPGQV